MFICLQDGTTPVVPTAKENSHGTIQKVCVNVTLRSVVTGENKKNMWF
jgi:hypothetical protein